MAVNEYYLDELDDWLEDFSKQPGASELPKWLAAYRSLRRQSQRQDAQIAMRVSWPDVSPADRLRLQLEEMEETQQQLFQEMADVKQIMAGYAFAVVFYGEHLLGRCQYDLRTNSADNTLWTCPPDCPVEARG